MPVAGGSEFEIGGSAHKSCIYMWCMCMAYTCGTSIIYMCYLYMVDIRNIRRGGGGENKSEVIKRYLQGPAKT